ncbi:MAG TPA: hypothetical protein VL354_14480 [Spirochaetia bacterium]|nr:hypothetical protein [Spirochaetia bacterium]
MREETGERLDHFIRELFFDLQTIDGVKPLEIWNGFRESDDQIERTSLIKNLYKIALPLANERCAGRAFEAHAANAYMTVEGVLACYSGTSRDALFERFPDPPTSGDEQKELYKMIKAKAAELATQVEPPEGIPSDPASGLDAGVFPDGLFDFREMRIVDNELPFIIFTDKEYRVIHGLAIVYGWLIDLESLFLQTLAENQVDATICNEYRQFSLQVHRENPLLMEGRKLGSQELIDYIRVKLQYQDYLDLFERVYRWFELAREKYNVQ